MLTPLEVMQKLEAIEQDLAVRQGEYEQAAEDWTRAKRDKEHAWAVAYLGAPGTNVTDRKAVAIEESHHIGADAEARYTALRAAVDVLQTRATIGMAILKAHGRAV